MCKRKTLSSINSFLRPARIAAILFVVAAAITVLSPRATAQISIGINVQPTCQYGYYEVAPYSCAPYGYYGPGYFHNGIFLGMGPWAGWGYGHGWGGHRFNGEGGGSYHGRGGYEAESRHYSNDHRGRDHKWKHHDRDRHYGRGHDDHGEHHGDEHHGGDHR